MQDRFQPGQVPTRGGAGDALDEHLNRVGRAARCGPIDWDPVAGDRTPIADPTRPIDSAREIAQSIAEAPRRLGRG